jgi:uncharacterized protein YggT (Ycf19 family)
MLKLLRELLSITITIIAVLLAGRFILRLLGASSSSPFGGWIYDTTGGLIAPFAFAFPTPSARGGFVLEFSTLFAIFVYVFVGYIIQEILQIIETKSNHR